MGKTTLKNIVIGTALVVSALTFGCRQKGHESYGVGEFKGYALANPEILDVDNDGKADILINPDREAIPNLDLNLQTRNLIYRKAIVKSGYLPQYAGEDIEVVDANFFDEMFPVRRMN